MSGVEFAARPGADAPPPVEEELVPSPARRLPRLRRLGHRSLTSRLVTGVVSLVVVLVVLVSSGTYLALRWFLLDRLDQQITTVAAQNAVFFDNCIGPFPIPAQSVRCPTGPVPQQEWIVILDSAGSVAVEVNSTTGTVRSLSLSNDAAMSISRNPGAIRSVAIRDDVELRVTGVRTQDGFVVVTGLSTGEVKTTLRQLVLLELIIGGAAVALALFMTYAGVRFSLRGLRRVTTTAQEVAAELGPSGVALQRRVPVTEQGTEVAQLTESFNTMLHSADTQFAARVESEERMRRFLADASHELRTPLTSIRGYAELARMHRAVGRTDEDNLDRIESEGTRMSRLVEDLLLLARGDAPDADPQRVPIDVQELVSDVVSSARAAHPDRAIEIDAMRPGQILGDPDQLLRVVRNLVTNAVVHTPPGPPIRIRAFPDGAGFAIQVIDAGPGLPPEEAAHVFERFWRADKARTRARGGSGLGLSIVATIVQAHGGSVYFDSAVEAGSTVTLWLPAAT